VDEAARQKPSTRDPARNSVIRDRGACQSAVRYHRHPCAFPDRADRQHRLGDQRLGKLARRGEWATSRSRARGSQDARRAKVTVQGPRAPTHQACRLVANEVGGSKKSFEAGRTAALDPGHLLHEADPKAPTTATPRCDGQLAAYPNQREQRRRQKMRSAPCRQVPLFGCIEPVQTSRAVNKGSSGLHERNVQAPRMIVAVPVYGIAIDHLRGCLQGDSRFLAHPLPRASSGARDSMLDGDERIRCHLPERSAWPLPYRQRAGRERWKHLGQDDQLVLMSGPLGGTPAHIVRTCKCGIGQLDFHLSGEDQQGGKPPVLSEAYRLLGVRIGSRGNGRVARR